VWISIIDNLLHRDLELLDGPTPFVETRPITISF
jgi:hypothetical protein